MSVFRCTLFARNSDSSLQGQFRVDRNEKSLEKGGWREAGRVATSSLPVRHAAQVPWALGIPRVFFPVAWATTMETDF